ncbi:MAG: hypothetical protein ABR564_06105 [Candidatus Dormibacteria bacterium]
MNVPPSGGPPWPPSGPPPSGLPPARPPSGLPPWPPEGPLPARGAVEPWPAPDPEHDPWRRRSGWIVALCFLLPPLGLWLLWKRSSIKDGRRLAITAATGAVWAVLIAVVTSGTGSHTTPRVVRSPVASPTFTPLPTSEPEQTPPPTQPPTRVATPVPTPRPTPVLTPAPVIVPTASPSASTCGAPSNPYGYSFCGTNLVTTPPGDFCTYFSCAVEFADGTGYVVRCPDQTYIQGGGPADACQGHGGGRGRPLHTP